ncbi:MAG: hypothetical protein Fur0024_4910 [Patescibacteria group bacterium]
MSKLNQNLSDSKNQNSQKDDGQIQHNLASCPACETLFPLDSDFKVGDWVECPECFTSLEIKSLNPVVFFPITNTGK